MIAIEMLTVLGQALAATYALWGFFIMVMGLRRAYKAGKLSRPALILGRPILWVGLVLDTAVNLSVAIVLFMELPPARLQLEHPKWWKRVYIEALVTARLTRLIHDKPDTWRGRLALWICANLLCPFDLDGHHCNCEGLH